MGLSVFNTSGAVGTVAIGIAVSRSSVGRQFIDAVRHRGVVRRRPTRVVVGGGETWGWAVIGDVLAVFAGDPGARLRRGSARSKRGRQMRRAHHGPPVEIPC